MRRPAAAREVLRFTPLVQAGGADAPGVERVPRMPARARPEVVLAGRPSAEGAADAWAGRVEAFLLIRLAIQENRLVIREGAHSSIL